VRINHKLSFFVYINVFIVWKELVCRKHFKADLNCLILWDKFLTWEGRLVNNLMPK